MYPIALDLRGRRVLIAGGGTVAARKARTLLEAGASVTIVAPQVAPAVRELAPRDRLTLVERAFADADLDGMLLAFAATDVPAVNAAVIAAARARGILADDASGTVEGGGDFATAMAHRCGPLTFTVDSGGLSPSFARRLAGELRERFDDRYARAALAVGRARDYAKAVVPPELRSDVMAAIANKPIDELAAMNPSTVENEVEAAYDAARPGARPAAPPEPFVTLTCATRASALAMWQTRHVMGIFARAGLVSTVLQISTKGDRVQDRSLAALGTDAVFVKELETALRDRRADYAVHSCKDLPTTLPDDMHLAAIGPRADARDAFCSERYASLDALPAGALVGTSSPRRRAQLGALRPDLRFEPIRGNVETRLRKLRDGEFDAILLATAGLDRLELRATHTLPLPVDVMIPAVGQGALAIETRAAEAVLAERIHALFADRATEFAVRAERAFLRACRGGCQAPVGAHAAWHDGRLTLHAAIAAVDGSRVVRGSADVSGEAAVAVEALADALARRLLAEGGDALLAEVRPAAAGPAAAAAEPDAPLAGRVFLLPRTQDRPSQIAPALRGAGAEVVEAADADAAARGLGDRAPDALLFPSSGSVRAVAPYLAGLRGRGDRPIVAAMGEASAAAATEAGFPPDVVATEATAGAFVQSVTHYVIARDLP